MLAYDGQQQGKHWPMNANKSRQNSSKGRLETFRRLEPQVCFRFFILLTKTNMIYLQVCQRRPGGMKIAMAIHSCRVWHWIGLE